jgi:DNA-binding CsgD family transcriptional regulator
MARPRKTASPQSSDLLSAPHNYLYTGHDADEDRLVTTLLLAAEALTAALTPGPSPDSGRGEENVTYAQPVGVERPAFFEDYGWLCDLAGQVRARLAEDPRRIEMLEGLIAAFGDGTLLRALFRNLFPPPSRSPSLNHDGQPFLTAREVEVLREATRDLPEKEIAQRLDISEETVNTHFKHIYKKLGVHRPMQAVARAAVLGYLETGDIVWLREASGWAAPGCHILDYILGGTYDLQAEMSRASLRPLAAFGLLLAALCQLAGGLLHQRRNPSLRIGSPGVICELDAQGSVIRSFGADRLRIAHGIAVAPPAAALHGFTPGHLFVTSSYLLSQNLNIAEIVEYAPDGRFVRAIRGGADIGTRLGNCSALAFAADGRLLVGSMGETDALLEFTEGGAKVRRLADGCFPNIAVAPSGRIFAAQHSGTGCILKVLDGVGTLLQAFGGTPPGIGYGGIAVTGQGSVLALRDDGCDCSLVEFDPAGEELRALPVTGLTSGQLVVDSSDRLYVVGERSGEIKVFSLEALLLRRIDLRGKIVPKGVAAWEDGRLWVCGQVP